MTSGFSLPVYSSFLKAAEIQLLYLLLIANVTFVNVGLRAALLLQECLHPACIESQNIRTGRFDI